jgi:hypothetical protein
VPKGRVGSEFELPRWLKVVDNRHLGSQYIQTNSRALGLITKLPEKPSRSKNGHPRDSLFAQDEKISTIYPGCTGVLADNREDA